jgi:hypothetical protein
VSKHHSATLMNTVHTTFKERAKCSMLSSLLIRQPGPCMLALFLDTIRPTFQGCFYTTEVPQFNNAVLSWSAALSDASYTRSLHSLR